MSDKRQVIEMHLRVGNSESAEDVWIQVQIAQTYGVWIQRFAADDERPPRRRHTMNDHHAVDTRRTTTTPQTKRPQPNGGTTITVIVIQREGKGAQW